MTDTLTVAMPTSDSADVIDETLTCLATAVAAADVTVAELVVADDSTDDTLPRVREHAERHDWPLTLIEHATTLPDAREECIAAVDTAWFLFLDDDVRVGEAYLRHLLDARAPAVGAVQGRKQSRTEQASDWVRRRARRGGTHATLCRTAAVEGVLFPDNLHVLEDEYLRRYVEAQGYLWTFHHQARFTHDCQDRHPIGWQEGRLAGQYGLAPFHQYALNVPFAVATGRNPWPHAKRAVGWLAGRLGARDAPAPEPTAVTDGGEGQP